MVVTVLAMRRVIELLLPKFTTGWERVNEGVMERLKRSRAGERSDEVLVDDDDDTTGMRDGPAFWDNVSFSLVGLTLFLCCVVVRNGDFDAALVVLVVTGVLLAGLLEGTDLRPGLLGAGDFGRPGPLPVGDLGRPGLFGAGDFVRPGLLGAEDLRAGLLAAGDLPAGLLGRAVFAGARPGLLAAGRLGLFAAERRAGLLAGVLAAGLFFVGLLLVVLFVGLGVLGDTAFLPGEREGRNDE